MSNLSLIIAGYSPRRRQNIKTMQVQTLVNGANSIQKTFGSNKFSLHCLIMVSAKFV